MPWFASFLYLYAAGTAAGIAVLPVRDLGRRFMAVHLSIAAALAVAAAVFERPFFGGGGTALVQGLGVSVTGSLLLAAGWSLASAPPQALLWLPPLAGTAWALALAEGSPALTAHLLTTGAVLGSALMAMNLGHWHLNDASLPFTYLARLCRIFLASAVAKTAAAAVVLAMSASWWRPILMSDFDGLLVMARVGAGCIAPIVFAAMALSCAKIRSNQSATGILYVAVVFTILGEVISMSLTLGKGRWA